MASGKIIKEVIPIQTGETFTLDSGYGAFPGYWLQSGSTFRCNISLDRPISKSVSHARLYGTMYIRYGSGSSDTITVSSGSPVECTIIPFGLSLLVPAGLTGKTNYQIGLVVSGGMTIKFS